MLHVFSYRFCLCSLFCWLLQNWLFFISCLLVGHETDTSFLLCSRASFFLASFSADSGCTTFEWERTACGGPCGVWGLQREMISVRGFRTWSNTANFSSWESRYPAQMPASKSDPHRGWNFSLISPFLSPIDLSTLFSSLLWVLGPGFPDRETQTPSKDLPRCSLMSFCSELTIQWSLVTLGMSWVVTGFV